MKNLLSEHQKYTLGTSTIFRLVVFFIGLFMSSQSIIAQQQTMSSLTDSLINDSLVVTPKGDTAYVSVARKFSEMVSPYVINGQRKIVFDFQIERHGNENEWIFIWLFIALAILTLFRNLFKNESEDFFVQLLNASSINNSGRLKLSSFSAFTFLLSTIFIVNTSIVSSFFLHHFFSSMKFNLLYTSVLFIFLFTLFLISKVAFVRVVGFVFEETESASFYTNDLLMLLQTFGISMFPVVVICVIGSEQFIYYSFVASLLIVALFIIFFAVCRLSTSIVLMYKSLYHFLLYICVAEILSVFLFIKLLTKIAF